MDKPQTWVLALPKIRTELIAKYVAKNGLWVLYPPKRYSIPPRLRFIVHPELLEITTETMVSTSERYPSKQSLEKRLQGTFEIVMKQPFKVWTKAYVVRIKQVPALVKVDKENGNVFIIPRKKNDEPKMKLVFAGFDIKSTAMGARIWWEFNINPIYTSVNSSGTGNHGILWAIWLVNVNQRILAKMHWISNRGVYTERIVDVEDGGAVERVEVVRVIRDWGWGSHVVIRDNWTNEEYEAIELHYHEARKTCARTEHIVEGKVELIYAEGANAGRTHWRELYKITAKPVKVTTIRITNSCKEEKVEVTIQ